MMYYENSGNTDQKEKGTVKIQVERLEADEDYTYVPYYTFLNDYYEIEGGDGAVKMCIRDRIQTACFLSH